MTTLVVAKRSIANQRVFNVFPSDDKGGLLIIFVSGIEQWRIGPTLAPRESDDRVVVGNADHEERMSSSSSSASSLPLQFADDRVINFRSDFQHIHATLSGSRRFPNDFISVNACGIRFFNGENGRWRDLYPKQSFIGISGWATLQSEQQMGEVTGVVPVFDRRTTRDEDFETVWVKTVPFPPKFCSGVIGAFRLPPPFDDAFLVLDALPARFLHRPGLGDTVFSIRLVWQDPLSREIFCQKDTTVVVNADYEAIHSAIDPTTNELVVLFVQRGRDFRPRCVLQQHAVARFNLKRFQTPPDEIPSEMLVSVETNTLLLLPVFNGRATHFTVSFDVGNDGNLFVLSRGLSHGDPHPEIFVLTPDGDEILERLPAETTHKMFVDRSTGMLVCWSEQGCEVTLRQLENDGSLQKSAARE